MALTALDFPASPTVGQLYPDPPVTGQPTYKWDGAQWLSYAAAKVPDAGSYAPFAAMSYSGMQINGSMGVSQDKGAAAIPVDGSAPNAIDGWRAQMQNASGVATGQQVAPAGTPAFGLGFMQAYQLKVTTAFGAAGATDLARLLQGIEGYRWARLGFGNANAQPITVGFWIYATVAGTASLFVNNGASNRSYVADIVVNAPTTWEWKTVTIPGDQSGVWLTTNGLGAAIGIGFGCGTTYQTTPNTWQSGFFFSTTNSTRFFTSTNNLVQVTGFVVLPGIEAPTAAQSPLIMRPYDQELLTCMRYYYKREWVGPAQWISVLQAYSANACSGSLYPFPVRMRTAPSYATTTAAAFGLTNAAGNTRILDGGTVGTTVDAAYANGFSSTVGGLVAGNAVIVLATNTANHTFDARL